MCRRLLSVALQNAQADPLELQKQAEARRRRRLARQKRALARVPTTPEPVEGRQHREVQTDLYLEEITEQPLEKGALNMHECRL